MAGDLRPALIGSAAVHVGVVLAGILAWPHREEPPKPPPVPVMLVSAPPGVDAAPPEAEPAPVATPAVEPQPLAEPEPPAAPPPQPAPPVAQPSPSPRPAPAQPAPSRTPAPQQPGPRPQPRATPAAAQPAPPAPAAEPSLDLAALRNKLARARPAAPPAPPGPTASELADARAELVARLNRAWNPNCGVPGGAKVIVRVSFALGADGRVSDGPEVVGGLSGDPVTRAAQERAVRAVLANQPYDWLPKEALGVSYTPRFDGPKACGG